MMFNKLSNIIGFWCLGMFCAFLPNIIFAQKIEDVKKKTASAVIYGEISNNVDVDTVEVIINEKFITSNYPSSHRYRIGTTRGNLFQGNMKERTFEVKLPPFLNPVQISLRTKAHGVINDFVVEPGDSVLFRISALKLQVSMGFMGKSAEKFRVQRELAEAALADKIQQKEVMISLGGNQTREEFLADSLKLHLFQTAQQKAKTGYGRVLQYLNPGTEEIDYLLRYLQDDFKKTAQWKTLMRNKGEISEKFYNLLYSNTIGEFLSMRIGFLGNYIKMKDKRVDSAYHKFLQDYPLVPNDQQQYSQPYINYLMKRMIVVSAKEQKPFIDIVCQELTGAIRDRVIARYVFNNYKHVSDSVGLITKALEIIKTPWLRDELKHILENSSVGKLVNFELPDTKNKFTKMSDFKGKVVLLDFWFTGCSPCKWLYQSQLKKLEQHFKNTDKFVKIAISVDKDQSKWLKSVSEGEYTSPSGVNLTTGGDHHQLIKEFDVRSYPYLMLVDQDGKLVRSSGLSSLTTEQLIKEIENLIK
ncbi:TlpA family protein disulfide reductase [Pedobacter insulae]|uniref:Thiol-disulfide isomerase or thioredoxin n=1 Tax=Pedobacter insulae TaxID=414048 RepID=A0A1I3AP79_9SPHI|nr:TlpA disulfide reductase family protein [Pedobacter insulae]SFH51141.1 Thiol-disulfide isomerase or thioredoxin [Pedobacter insulae]